MTWVVARTQPRRERWAAENIRRQGAEPYYPQYAERRVKDGKVVHTNMPLFPSYMFVKLLTARWRFLLGTFGLSTILFGPDGPLAVPDPIIAQIKARENADGVVILPNAPRFLNGERVRLTDGPLAGRIGLYEGFSAAHRERVLIEVLGRQTPVLIDGQKLEAA